MKLKKLTTVVASMLVVAMNVPTLAMADVANEAAQVKYFTPEVLFMAEEEEEASDVQNSNDDTESSEETIVESAEATEISDVVDVEDSSEIAEDAEAEVVTDVTEETVPDETEAVDEVLTEESEVVTEAEEDLVTDDEIITDSVEDEPVVTEEIVVAEPSEDEAEAEVIEEEVIIIEDSFDSKDALAVQFQADIEDVVNNDKTDSSKTESNITSEGEGGFGSIDIFADVDSGLDVDDVLGDEIDVNGAVGDSMIDDSTVDVPVADDIITDSTTEDKVDSAVTNKPSKPSTSTDTTISDPAKNPLTNGSVETELKFDKELFYEDIVEGEIIDDEVIEDILNDDKITEDKVTDDKVTEDKIIEDEIIDDSVVKVPEKKALTGAAGFVARIYTIALDREYEQAGLDYWVGELAGNKTDGFEIFKRITDCPEFRDRKLSDEEYLKVLYTTFFDREPDGDGFDYWKDKLANDEMYTREFVLACFVDSVEWANICTRYGILSGSDTEPTIIVITGGCRKFVERLYSTCLSREADQNGLDYWCYGIATSEYTGKFAAFSFITSPEFCGLVKEMTDEELVTTFYQIFFDREPEEDGLAYWVKELTTGEPTAVLFNGFSDSPEFAEICEKNGIVAGPSIVMDTTIKYDPKFEKFMNAYCGYGMNVLDEATKDLHPKTTYTYINVQGDEPIVEEIPIPATDIAAIEQFAREHFNSGWTPQMKIAYTFYWVHENMIYAYGGNVAPTFCVAAFQRRYGQCAQYNGSLVEMLCYYGYDAALIRGTRGSGAPGSQHFWGELYLNGETYVIEVGNADSDGTWNYFFVPYEFTRKFIKCGEVMGK